MEALKGLNKSRGITCFLKAHHSLREEDLEEIRFQSGGTEKETLFK